MRQQLCIAVAAAALAISPMAFAQNTPSDQSQNTNNTATDTNSQNESRNANETRSAKEPKDASAIQKTLAQVAEASVTKNGVNDMVERFSQPDRQRLDQDKQALKNSDTLNGRIAQFEKDWKAKYGHDFDIDHPNKTFDQSFAMINEGAGNAAETASGHVNANEANREQNGNEKAEKSATVNIPSRHEMAALDVPLVRESGKWKIDIPDSVDSRKLSDNVLTALTKVDEAKDQWPSDETQAQRMVSHQVLLGIFDKNNASSAQPAGAQVPPSENANPSQSQSQ